MENTMAKEQKRDSDEPFRQSGSGQDYDPNANWGAERRLDNPDRAAVPGPEGAPSGAGDGGYGPEGDYGSEGDAPNSKE